MAVLDTELETKQITAGSLYEYTDQLELALREKWKVSEIEYPMYANGLFSCTLERAKKIYPPIVTKTQSPVKGK